MSIVKLKSTTMNKGEQILCDYIINFFDIHFDRIRRIDILNESGFAISKESFIKELSNPQNAAWALCEFCDWGMDEDYYTPLIIQENTESQPYTIVMLSGNPIRIDTEGGEYKITQAVLKEKIIKYYE